VNRNVEKSQDETNQCLSHKGLLLDRSSYEVRLAGKLIPLTKQEYKILELLLLHPNKVFSKQEIYNYAWEENFIGVELFGADCNKQKELFSRIGVLIEAPGLFPNMTAFENLKMKCISLGIKDDNYIHETIELVGLKGVDKKKTKNYSLGMKQRLLYWKMKKAGIK